MSYFFDKYYRIIGILLVLLILVGGGLVYKKASEDVKTRHAASKENLSASNQVVVDAKKYQSSKININTASQEELESLPGIGPAKAKAIIDYRKKNGKFRSKGDIIKVKGIGKKIYEKIKNRIDVE